MFSLIDTNPRVEIQEAEYQRLLGYPKNYVLEGRARELANEAAAWFSKNGRPWIWAQEIASLELKDGGTCIEGTEFSSKKLREILSEAEAHSALLVAVSAGKECEEHAQKLWNEGKPDEYFFLEIFGSAVVEHLVASLNGRICALAEPAGFIAVPHYSPGYTGWDVADQNKLFELIAGGAARVFPEPVTVLSSGMLQPKKSLLAVVGLAPKTGGASESTRLVPCGRCAFTPCSYRRAPYQPAGVSMSERPLAHVPAESHEDDATDFPLTREAKYTVSARALQKWSVERVRIERNYDGSVTARFRFDGTTCSNMGRPLIFDYEVELSAPEDRYIILRADCRPAPGDEGHKYMCAYINDAESLMDAIATEKPLLGRPLNDVLDWARPSAPSGCHCNAESRAHKWGLALEAIHYALVHSEAQKGGAGFQSAKSVIAASEHAAAPARPSGLSSHSP